MESAGLPGRLNVSAYTYDPDPGTSLPGSTAARSTPRAKGDVDMYFIERDVELDSGLAAE